MGPGNEATLRGGTDGNLGLMYISHANAVTFDWNGCMELPATTCTVIESADSVFIQ